MEHPFTRRWSAAELAQEDDEIRWVVRGVLTDDTFAIIAGREKSLKTELGLNVVVAVASGKPFLGEFPVDVQGPVVCYVGEGGRRPFKRRLQRVCDSFDVKLADLDITIREGALPICSLEFEELLRRDLAELRPVLLWVDPYYAYAGASVSSSQLNEGEQSNKVSKGMAASYNLVYRCLSSMGAHPTYWVLNEYLTVSGSFIRAGRSAACRSPLAPGATRAALVLTAGLAERILGEFGHSADIFDELVIRWGPATDNE